MPNMYIAGKLYTPSNDSKGIKVKVKVFIKNDVI